MDSNLSSSLFLSPEQQLKLLGINVALDYPIMLCWKVLFSFRLNYKR
jgi:hypothetical protein